MAFMPQPSQPGAPVGAAPMQRPQPRPQGGPPQAGGGGGNQLNPQAVQNLARAMTPDNFKTFMQIFGAVMLDTYQLIQKSSQGQAPGGPPQPGAAPGGLPGPPPGPPQGGMMGAPKPPMGGGMPPGGGGGPMGM